VGKIITPNRSSSSSGIITLISKNKKQSYMGLFFITQKKAPNDPMADR
jgi:MFS-type transporter involved in bile tolerance (Atg22 family)